MEKSTLSAHDRVQLSIKIIAFGLILGAYMLMQCITYIEEKTATKAFFLMLATALAMLVYCEHDKHWFFKALFPLCLWNICDELIGRACVVDWFEPLGALLTFVYYYKTRNSEPNTFKNINDS